MSRLAKHLLTKPTFTSPKATTQLRFESLEDRSLMSTNIPLNGNQFTPIGPAPLQGTTPALGDLTGGLTLGGRVLSIGLDPTNQNLGFIGTSGGGVAKTTNLLGDAKQVTWSHLTDNLPDSAILGDTTNRNNFIGTVAVNPFNSNWVYAGQGDFTLTNHSYSGRGLLTSKDGGATWQLQQGPGGAFDRANFQKFVFHPTDQNIVFAVVNRGWIDSSDKVVGSARYSDPTGPNAVWRSFDGGDTWDDITTAISSAIPSFNISRGAMLTDFSFDRSNPNIAYVAIGNPTGYALNGVYRTDQALNPNSSQIRWTVAFGGNGNFVPGSQIGNIRLASAPTSSSTIYMMFDRFGGPPGGDPAFFRSTDSGVTWTQKTAIASDTPGFVVNYFAMDMFVDPQNASRIYASGAGSTPVVFSNDGGNSWQSISKDKTGEGPYPLIHTMRMAADRSIIFCTSGGVFRMTIDQSTFAPTSVDWTSLNGSPSQNGLNVGPGVNGASAPNALNAQQIIGVALPPGADGERYQDDAIVYGSYLQGANKFFDPGTQITRPSPEFGNLFTSTPTAPNSMTYPVYDFLNSNKVYAVNTDHLNTNGVSSGVQVPQLLGSLDPVGSSNPIRSLDGGQTWSLANTGVRNPDRTYWEFSAPLQMDPSNQLRLLYGTDVVNISTNGGTSWDGNALPDLPFVTGQTSLATTKISQIGIGRFTGGIIYAAVGGRLVPGTSPPVDAGPAIYVWPGADGKWLDASPGRQGPAIMPPTANAPPNPAPNALLESDGSFAQVTDLLVDPVDSRVIYATVDTNTTNGRVYRSTNGGVTGWVDITGNLPVGGTPGTSALRVFSVALDPRELGNSLDDEVYIGTEVGIYKLINPTTGPFNWVRVAGNSGQPLPDVMVRDIVINTTTGVLTAATMGRGIWQLQVRPYVRGFVFEDKNGNGIQDPAITDPTPIAGETAFNPAITDKVQAFDISNVNNIFESANTQTTNNGFYVFRSLKNSTYEFKVQNASYNTVDANATYQITTVPRINSLSQTSFINNVDVGLFRRVTIGGNVYNDLNANQKQDVGEPGLANWVLELRDQSNNTLLATTTTDATGAYSFKGVGVSSGNKFRVVEQVQTGWTPVNPNTAIFDLPNVLFSGDNSFSNNITFGNFKLASIAGTLFEDINGDGLLNGSDPGVKNRVVQLFNSSGTLLNTTTTDNLGAYTFTGLTFGSYTIQQVVPAGWKGTTASPFAFSTISGTTLTGINLGTMQAGSISGTLFEDLNGDGIQQITETTTIPNATVALIDPRDKSIVATTTSSITGTYTFNNIFPLQIPGGNTIPYQVQAIGPATYVQTSALPSVTLTSNTANNGRDIGLFLRTSISGFAFEDINGNGFQDPGEPPLSGGLVGLLNANSNQAVGTTTTDTSGNFTFSNLGPLQVPSPGGSVIPYTVGGTGLGTVLTTPLPPPITLTSGIPVGGIIVGLFRQVLFSGIVFNDISGNGLLDGQDSPLANIPVQLVNAGTNKVVANTTTDANGKYVLPSGPGTFTVRIGTQPGFVQTSTNPGNFTVQSGQTVPQANFGLFKSVVVSGLLYHDINGDRIRQSNEPPLPSFTVQLRNSADQTIASVSSAADGSFAIPNVGPGSFKVVELPPNPWRINGPNPLVFNTVSGSNVSLTFANVLPVTLNGRVFEDQNSNGKDDGEPGLGGWTVQLLGGGQVVGTTLTQPNGTYTFTGVIPPGPLQTKLVAQPGWVRTNGDSLPITFNSGSTNSVTGFGVLRLGSLSGSVFLDSNRNSRRDLNERGLSNATVGLFDALGTQISQQQTTADGFYSFLNLQPASYGVRLLTSPSGFALSGPNATSSYTRTVASSSSSPNNNIIDLNFPLLGRKRYAVAADGGGGPRVQVYDAVSGDLLKDFFVYEVSFTGGVRVASADANGDGVDDLIVAAGKGGGPRVRVIDGLTDQTLYDFFVYEPSFRDGMYVAAGDVNGDGFADLVTGTDAGGGPRVTVYSGKDGSQIADYFAYDSNQRGGVRIGVGDINGDGIDEVLTVPGKGVGATVITWGMNPLRVVSSFNAFDPSYTGGAFVAGGTVGVDGRSLVIVGSGANYPGSPVVRTFDGVSGVQRIETQAFFPFVDGSEFTGEVRVSSFDRNGDGVPDLVPASGAGGPSRIRFLDGRNLRQIGDEVNPFETAFTGGVFIG